MASKKKKLIKTKPDYSPSLSVLVFIALLCLLFTTQSDAFFNLNHYKILAALLGAITLLLLAVLDSVKVIKFVPAASSGKSSSVSTGVLLLLFLPILATLPGLAWSGGEFAYFFAQEIVTWFICCAWLMLALYFFDARKHMMDLLAGLALITSICSLLAIVNYFGPSTELAPTALNRVSGSFGNPNYLAAYLILQLPVYMVCLLPGVKLSSAVTIPALYRLMFVAAVALGIMALLLTQSRASLLTFAASSMTLFVVVFIQNELFGISRKVLLYAFISGCVVLVAVLLFLPIVDYLIERMRSGSSLSSRLVPWRAAWQSIMTAPWIGWGAGSSYALFFQFVEPASRLLWFERSYVHPHNEYIELWQEGGVFALGAYLVFVGYFASVVMKSFKDSNLEPSYKIMLTGICLGLLSYHLLALVSVAPRMISVRLIFFLLLALVLLIHRLSIPVPAANTAVDSPTLLKALAQSVSRPVLLWFTFFVLMSGSVLYYPDAMSRYSFVKILNIRNNQQQLSALQQLRENRPNVYALDLLVQRELLLGDTESASRSLEILEGLVPNYLGSIYFRSVVALLEDNEREARDLALAYQSQDNYHSGTAFLLARLAILEDDTALLLSQLRLLLEHSFITEANLGLSDSESIQLVVQDDSSGPSLEIGEGNSFLRLTLPESTLQEIVLRAGSALSDPSDQRHLLRYQRFSEEIIENLQFAGFTQPEKEQSISLLSPILEGLASLSL